MKIKTGDKVKVISGKDRGKIGKVLQSFPVENRLVVDRANKLIKHIKPQKQGEKGQRIEFFAPLHISNVMLICSNCNKPTRVGYKLIAKKKERICKKCQGVLDSK